MGHLICIPWTMLESNITCSLSDHKTFSHDCCIWGQNLCLTITELDKFHWIWFDNDQRASKIFNESEAFFKRPCLRCGWTQKIIDFLSLQHLIEKGHHNKPSTSYPFNQTKKADCPLYLPSLQPNKKKGHPSQLVRDIPNQSPAAHKPNPP